VGKHVVRLGSRIGTKVRTDLDYMTAGEMQMFRSLREANDISFYRTAACRMCGTEILKGKTYCSRKCKAKKERQMANWYWDIDISNLYRKNVKVVTKDAVYLEGYISQLITESFVLDGVTVDIPVSLELDDDQEKRIDVGRIESVTITEVENGES
jgi:hypothetical protein